MKKALSISSLLIAIALIVFFGIRQARALVQFDIATANPNIHYQFFTFFASTSAQTYLGNQAISTSTNATSTNITPYFDSNGRLDNGAFNIAGARQVTFYFTRNASGAGNFGTSTFKVQVSPDASSTDTVLNQSDWIDYTQLLIANTNADLRATSTTIANATTTNIVNMDLSHGSYGAVRCIVVHSLDGIESCSASATW